MVYKKVFLLQRSNNVKLETTASVFSKTNLMKNICATEKWDKNVILQKGAADVWILDMTSHEVTTFKELGDHMFFLLSWTHSRKWDAKVPSQHTREFVPRSLLLQFKDVHCLGVAGRTQELAIMAEGQWAYIDIPKKSQT